MSRKKAEQKRHEIISKIEADLDTARNIADEDARVSRLHDVKNDIHKQQEATKSKIGGYHFWHSLKTYFAVALPMSVISHFTEVKAIHYVGISAGVIAQSIARRKRKQFLENDNEEFLIRLDALNGQAYGSIHNPPELKKAFPTNPEPPVEQIPPPPPVSSKPRGLNL